MNQKKNAFTLIELLAVIVILGIIAVIAVPIVKSITKDAKMKAFANTARGILRAGDLYYSRKDMLDEINGDTTFNFSNDVSELQINGKLPKSGIMIVNKDGDISLAISDGKYCAIKGYTDKDVSVSEDIENCKLPKTYNIGDVVYYNPETNEMCTNYVDANSEPDVRIGCLKWYVYSVNGANAKMMLDHDIELDNNSSSKYSDFTDENTSQKEYQTIYANILYDELKNWKPILNSISSDDILKLLPWYNKLTDKNEWFDSYFDELIDIENVINYEDYNSDEEYANAMFAEADNRGLLFPKSFSTREKISFFDFDSKMVISIFEKRNLYDGSGDFDAISPSIELINGKVKVQSEDVPLIEELYVPSYVNGKGSNTYNIYDEMKILVYPANADKSKIKITLEDQSLYTMDEFGNITIPACSYEEKMLTIKTTDGSNITKTATFSGGYGCPS